MQIKIRFDDLNLSVFSVFCSVIGILIFKYWSTYEEAGTVSDKTGVIDFI